jgi:hypothetical protein
MVHLTHDIEFPPQQDPICCHASRILHPSLQDFGGNRFASTTSNNQVSNPSLGSNGADQVNPRLLCCHHYFPVLLLMLDGSIWLRWFEPSCASFLEVFY